MTDEKDDGPDIVFGDTIYDITERSDIDQHTNIKADDLGEDWGDGFFVNPEPVLVQRNAMGHIVRTTPLSEIPGMTDDIDEDAEPIEGRMNVTPTPLATSEREKLAGILTARLFKFYQSQPPSLTAYNPIYDGIPKAPHSRHDLQPLPGTQMYPATLSEVFEWLQGVIAARVQIVNKKRNLRGYTGDMSDYTMRLSRDPVE